MTDDLRQQRAQEFVDNSHTKPLPLGCGGMIRADDAARAALAFSDAEHTELRERVARLEDVLRFIAQNRAQREEMADLARAALSPQIGGGES